MRLFYCTLRLVLVIPVVTAVMTAVVLSVALPACAFAQEARFKDPEGDDDGPGTYVYPADPAYKPGSFDLVRFSALRSGDRVEFKAGMRVPLEDPWKTGSGFSVQMLFVFIRTGRPGAVIFDRGIPGLNVQFGPFDGWDRCVILSPEPAARVRAEVEHKVPPAMRPAVLVPEDVRGADRDITGSVPVRDLGDDPEVWGYQVVVQSNNEFPAWTDVLTRRVEAQADPQCFGGGEPCAPRVIDCLAGMAQGEEGEAAAQHDMLRYRCGSDSPSDTASAVPAVLRMVRQTRR